MEIQTTSYKKGIILMKIYYSGQGSSEDIPKDMMNKIHVMFTFYDFRRRKNGKAKLTPNFRSFLKNHPNWKGKHKCKK